MRRLLRETDMTSIGSSRSSSDFDIFGYNSHGTSASYEADNYSHADYDDSFLNGNASHRFSSNGVPSYKSEIKSILTKEDLYMIDSLILNRGEQLQLEYFMCVVINLAWACINNNIDINGLRHVTDDNVLLSIAFKYSGYSDVSDDNFRPVVKILKRAGVCLTKRFCEFCDSHNNAELYSM